MPGLRDTHFGTPGAVAFVGEVYTNRTSGRAPVANLLDSQQEIAWHQVCSIAFGNLIWMDSMASKLATTAFAFALGAAGGLAPAVVGGKALAAPISGSDSIITFSVNPIGGVGDLLSATSLQLINQFWGGGSGDFASLPSGTPLGNSNITLGSLGSYSFSGVDGTFTGAPTITIGANTYTSAVVGTSGSLAAGSESLSLYIVGHFTPAGTMSAFATNTASETISFTETGISNSGAGGNFGSFSVSSTFAAPAAASPAASLPTDTPEPASIMLLGAGLLGLGAFRRGA